MFVILQSYIYSVKYENELLLILSLVSDFTKILSKVKPAGIFRFIEGFFNRKPGMRLEQPIWDPSLGSLLGPAKLPEFAHFATSAQTRI